MENFHSRIGKLDSAMLVFQQTKSCRNSFQYMLQSRTTVEAGVGRLQVMEPLGISKASYIICLGGQFYGVWPHIILLKSNGHQQSDAGIDRSEITEAI